MGTPVDTDIEISSAALVMIGADPITSFEDGTTESLVASNLYESVVRSALTQTRWRFATNQATLNRLTSAPTSRWDAAYQLPTGILLLHAVTINDNQIAYDKYGDKVYCNASTADSVVADYTFRADEQDWPAYFTLGVQFQLAAAFAVSVARDTALSNMFDQKQQVMMARARSADSQQQITRKLHTSRFISQRRT